MERQGVGRGPDTSKPEVVSPQKTFMSSGSWQGLGRSLGPRLRPGVKKGGLCVMGTPAGGSDPGEGVHSG